MPDDGQDWTLEVASAQTLAAKGAAVFVSYARENADLRSALAASLLAQNIEAHGDWELVPGPAYQGQLDHAIREADAFVFLITPRSITSPACLQEIFFASQLKKKILPALCEPIPHGVEIPAGLASPQWAYLTGSQAWESGVANIVRSVNSDYELMRLHTQITLAEQAWRDGAGPLLSGKALAQANRWEQQMLARPRQAPGITQLQQGFIAASRKAALRRSQVIGASTALAIFLVGLAGVIAYDQWQDSQQASARANSRGFASAAEQPLQQGDVAQALQLALKGCDLAPTFECASVVFEAWGDYPRLSAVLAGPGAAGDPRQVEVTPDGSVIGVLDDGKIHLWNRKTRKKQVLIQPGSPLMAFAASPDGKQIAAGDENGVLLGWNIGDEQSVPALRIETGEPLIRGIGFSSDGKLLATAHHGDAVRVWNLATGTDQFDCGKLTMGWGGIFWSVSFSPDGGQLAATGNGNSMLWPLKPCSVKPEVIGGDGQAISFSPDGGEIFIAGGAHHKSLRLRPDSDGKFKQALVVFPAYSVVYNRERMLRVVGTTQGTVRVRPVAGSGPDQSWKVPAELPSNVGVSSGGSVVATSHFDGQVMLWALDDADRKLAVDDKGDEYISSLAFSPSGRLLAAGTFKGRVYVWNVGSSARSTQSPIQLEKGITSIAWSPDGQTLAAGDFDGRITLLDFASGKSPRTFPLGKEMQSIGALAFSPNGKLLAGSGNAVQVISLDSNQTVNRIEMRGQALAFSADGRRLAIGSNDGQLAIIDVFSGKRADWKGTARVLGGITIEQAIYKLSFRPGGRMLAATHYGIQELDVAGPGIQPVGEPLPGSGVAKQMALTADLVAGVAEDASSWPRVRLWDAESHRVFPIWAGPQNGAEIAGWRRRGPGPRCLWLGTPGDR